MMFFPPVAYSIGHSKQKKKANDPNMAELLVDIQNWNSTGDFRITKKQKHPQTMTPKHGILGPFFTGSNGFLGRRILRLDSHS